MAENMKKIVYSIELQTKSGEINVKNLSEQLKGLNVEVTKFKS